MSLRTPSRSRRPAPPTSSRRSSACSSRSVSKSSSSPEWSRSAAAPVPSPIATRCAPSRGPPSPMPDIYYDNDADLSLIRARKVAVIGYGSQGHAHALNLKDSGVQVRVGLAPQSKSRAKAESHGVTVVSPAEAAAWADVVMVLVPDTTAPSVYAEMEPHMTAGKMLMFAHGFNIRFGTVKPAADIDVTMIAPKSPGHRV